MKTISSNLIQIFIVIPSPATCDCVGKSLKMKTKFSGLIKNFTQTPVRQFEVYKKISKNENQVQQLDSKF